jgi:hypothetical protein
MKKIIGISMISFLMLGFSLNSYAQTTTEKVESTVDRDAKKVGTTVKKDAKKVGHKSAELASKGKSRVTDKVYEDKVGPDGQTIYIDRHSKYYWIDKRGHRHYTTDEALKDKTES